MTRWPRTMFNKSPKSRGIGSCSSFGLWNAIKAARVL